MCVTAHHRAASHEISLNGHTYVAVIWGSAMSTNDLNPGATPLNLNLVNSGEVEYLRSLESGTIINGGTQVVQPGGFASSSIINSGGIQDIFGRAEASTVNSEGIQRIEAGGTSYNAMLNGSVQFDLGTANDAILQANSTQIVGTDQFSSATANNAAATANDQS